jgi:hypothetical protein
MAYKIENLFKIVQGVWLILFIFLGFYAAVNPTPLTYFITSSIILMGLGAITFLTTYSIIYAYALISEGYRALRGQPPTADLDSNRKMG